MNESNEMLQALRTISQIENEVGLSFTMENIKEALEKRLADKLAVPIEEEE